MKHEEQYPGYLQEQKPCKQVGEFVPLTFTSTADTTQQELLHKYQKSIEDKLAWYHNQIISYSQKLSGEEKSEFLNYFQCV